MDGPIKIAEAARLEELEQVRELFRNYQVQLSSRLRFPDSEWQDLPGAHARPGGTLLLATTASQPSGCVGLRPFPAHGVCEMKRLHVCPEFRGQGRTPDRENYCGRPQPGLFVDETRHSSTFHGGSPGHSTVDSGSQRFRPCPIAGRGLDVHGIAPALSGSSRASWPSSRPDDEERPVATTGQFGLLHPAQEELNGILVQPFHHQSLTQLLSL